MIKKLLYSVILVAGLSFLAACSKDDSVYEHHDSVVKIVESNVIFDANANTGTVLYEAPGAAEAIISSDWVTASVSGNTVTVNVTANPYSEGRTAKLTLKYGADVTYVTVQQTGARFSYSFDPIIVCGDTASTRVYPIKLAGEAKIWSKADWLSATASTTELKVNVAKNDTGKRRGAWLYFKVGADMDSLYVDQYDFDKTVLGDYYLAYYNSSSKKWVSTGAALEKTDAGKYQLRFTSSSYANMGVVLPVECDPLKFTMTIWNLTDMEGKYTKNNVDYVFNALTLYTNGSSVYRSSNAGFAIVGSFNNNDDGTQTWDFDFNDVLDKTQYEYYALRFIYGTGGYNGSVGNYVTFIGMYLLKK